MKNHHEIYTLGHSTRPIAEFVSLLEAHGIEHLIDVRTIPRSRHNPQFNSDALAKVLSKEGIDYTHLKELGGLRRPLKDSPNRGWRNASFRGYADYMQTEGFEIGLDKLIKRSHEKKIAIMCAEALPWRCHRSMISDALVAKKIKVEHIFTEKKKEPHSLNPMAVKKAGHLLYPVEVKKAKRKKKKLI
jgi:uncharacterized protein (DUF488 family)